MAMTLAAGRFRQHSIIPGFGLTFGIMLTYLGLIVLIPLAVLFAQAAGAGGAKIWAELSSPRTLSAFRVSFGCALLAALINAVAGLVVGRGTGLSGFSSRGFVGGPDVPTVAVAAGG